LSGNSINGCWAVQYFERIWMERRKAQQRYDKVNKYLCIPLYACFYDIVFVIVCLFLFWNYSNCTLSTEWSWYHKIYVFYQIQTLTGWQWVLAHSALSRHYRTCMINPNVCVSKETKRKTMQWHSNALWRK